jgi:hypothetical protein
MPDKGRPTPDTDRKGPEGSSFTISGRVSRWDPIARELTIGGRVLSVADSVYFVGGVAAGVLIMASGYQPPGRSDRGVVTRLRIG